MVGTKCLIVGPRDPEGTVPSSFGGPVSQNGLLGRGIVGNHGGGRDNKPNSIVSDSPDRFQVFFPSLLIAAGSVRITSRIWDFVAWYLSAGSAGCFGAFPLAGVKSEQTRRMAVQLAGSPDSGRWRAFHLLLCSVGSTEVTDKGSVQCAA